MPADFYVHEQTRERMALAAELIVSGGSVNFGGYKLTVSPAGELIVAILTDEPEVGPEIEAARGSVDCELEAIFHDHRGLSAFQQLPRRYELVADWGKGGTWLGCWSADGFKRGRPPAA
ncbi:MAG TPA: hypothetical protein VHR66_15035 [Gemmataceae bacterium]|jgi:hypothetical protein|nr:hypothetical protein [Gemmataceae bacterium]